MGLIHNKPYWADAYSRQIKRGDRFGKLEKTISIAILDHELEELKGMEEIGVKWQIRDEQASIEYAQNVGYKSGYDNGENNGKNEKKHRNSQKQMTVQDIADVTGLSPEKIEALK